MLAIQKNITIFASFNAKNISKYHESVAIFFATYSALSLQIIGCQIQSVSYTACEVNVLGGTGGDSLLYFIFFKFHSIYAKNNENLHASEQQYLARNAHRCENRLFSPRKQPRALIVQPRSTSICLIPAGEFSRITKDSYQEAHAPLRGPGKNRQSLSPGKRLFRGKRRPQLPDPFHREKKGACRMKQHKPGFIFQRRE